VTAQQTDMNGFIEVENQPLSVAGIYEYYGSEIDAPEPDKLYRVFRSPESLEKAVPMFTGKPIVDDHTMLGDGQTDAAKKGIQGAVGDNVYYKDGTIYGNIRLYTSKIKQLIDQGKKELSFGYWSQYEFKSGTWQGKAYDAIQHIVGGNHLALVDEGRMGSTVAVLDHAPRFSQLTFTFDHKALPMDDDNKQTTDEDIDDSIKEPPEEQAIEDKTDMMQTATIQSLSDKVDKLAAMVEAMHGKAPEPEATTDEFPPEKDDEDEKKVETTDSIAKRVRLDIAKADELYKLAQPLVGTFDHSGKSAKEVADYAAGKLGLSGDSETALRAFVIGKQQAKAKATQDAAPTAQKLAGNTYE
jgi:hypothetical protein